MADLRGWGTVDPGPFRFGPQSDPTTRRLMVITGGRDLSELTDAELEAIAGAIRRGVHDCEELAAIVREAGS